MTRQNDRMRRRGIAMALALVLAAVPAAAYGGTVKKNGGAAAAGAGPAASQASSFEALFVPRATAAKTGGYYFNGTGMYTYEQMEQDLAALAGTYGIPVDSLTTTADGRNVYHTVLGNAGAPKKILAVASTHGREYMTSQLLMRQVKDILDRRAAGDTSLNSVCIHVIPMLGPDGVAISQYGIKGLRTQGMRNQVNGILQSWADWDLLTDSDKYLWYLNKWKNNGSGVDLNRNFSTAGWEGLNDLRGKPANDLYKGPSPESEPETRAFVQLVRQQKFDEVLSYHAQGQVIYWYVPGAPEAVNARNQVLAELVRLDTGYSPVAAENSGTGIGSMKTWLNQVMGIPAVTIETGLGTCPLPESDLDGIWQKNRTVLYDMVTELLVGWDEYCLRKGYTQPAEETAAAETSAEQTEAAPVGPGQTAAGPGAAAPTVTEQSVTGQTAAGPAETMPAATEQAGVVQAAPPVSGETSSASGTVSAAEGQTAAAEGGVLYVEAIPSGAP